jgi:hypothetical protein
LMSLSEIAHFIPFAFRRQAGCSPLMTHTSLS